MLFNKFNEVAQGQLDTLAVDVPGFSASYGELRDLVLGYAGAIKDLAGNKQYVALIADQDPQAVVAILALAHLGIAVVPIDPRLDKQLVSEMLMPFTDVILVGVGSRINRLDGFKCYSLKDLESKQLEDGMSNPNPDTPAYILHTSGTTGKPKAVIASQGALMRVSKRLAERYYITRGSRVLQFAQLSFDSALAEIWGALLSGGTLVVAGQDLRNDLYGTLRHLLKDKKITAVTLPPSVVAHCKPEEFEGMQTLVVAGEPCPPTLANSVRKHVAHFINAYGPTEAIIGATTYEVTSDCADYVPIGKPLEGIQIVLVDPATGKPSRSDTGEAYIVGDSLATGYPNDPAKTAERFAIDPEVAQARFYKSGDIVKKLASSDFVFLGRLDNQVKINGQRIEIESIESALQNLNAFKQVAVVFIKDGQAKGLHCAYEADAEVVASEIAAKLKGTVQDFAIPKSYVKLNELPVDRNGKIDHKELAELVVTAISQTQAPSQGESNKQVEEMIVLWKQILGADRDVRPNSDFFELGGDSLSALRLVADINQKFNVEVGLTDIIADQSTPQTMADVVAKKGRDA